MKKYLFSVRGSLYRCLFLLIALSLSIYSNAQIRQGSIDLTGAADRYILMNDDASNNTLGIEGGEFTIEGWVYLAEDSDFNFFRLRSGDRVFCLSYRGDGNKNEDDVWYFETKGLPEKGGGSNTWNWYEGYKSGYSAPDFYNQWRHIAFTVNAGSQVKIYIDGELAVYQTCTHNGSQLASIWPADGDGNSLIGGESINKDRKGRMYVGEIRVWDAQLSASEIATYYDEEVNKSHPHWNDLIRYYHGTEFSGTGSSRTFEDRSPSGTEYDAAVSNSDVGIVTSQNPPVRPPAFNNTTFNPSFSANTCQTNDIDISWSNLRTTGASNYSTYDNSSNHRYYMEVTRDSDGKVMHQGTSTSATDTDVSEGFKDRYVLKTYWKVNGTTYYSDDSKTSGYGTIKDQYDAPTNFSVSTENCDKSIDLEWSASDGTPPQWKIEKSTSSTFSSVAGTAYVDGNVTKYTSSNQSVETNIYYRVTPYGTDDNSCSVSGTKSDIVMGFTSKAPSVPTNATITQDLVNKQLKIDWTNPSGNNADSWIIKRSKFDGSSEVEFTTALGTTSYDDTDLELCETYSYTLGAVNECSPDGEFATTDLTGNISTDLSGAIATMEASKGYLSDAVQVEWSLNGSLSNIDRFRLYRSRADKNNFSLIKVLDNDLIYTDETALGSVFYNYKVVGEAACNENTIYTNEGIDMGFVIPYGVANGHVEYEGGNAVEGVTVNFEKQDGASGNSLEMDGVDDYVAINNLYYKSTTEKEMTVEAWIKVQENTDNIIASFDRSDYWRFEIAGSAANPGCVGVGIMTDAGLLDFGGKIRVDDNEWHHVAATFDNGLTSLYVDGLLDDATTMGTQFGSGNVRYGFIGAGSEADEFNGGVNNDFFFGGNIDEVRIWNVALSADEIAENYNRIINGSEDGLMLYYRFDEGIGSEVYDASQTDDEFNKNDGTFINEVAFSDEIPSSSQLGLKGITDEYGDYTINYVPYNSGGEIFKVTPSSGQHAFEPSSRTVFVGDGAQTQNGLDFTDISSFTVTGAVTYYNTNVPVKDALIYVDGDYGRNNTGGIIRTDDEGKYSVSVPIGQHYISVTKDDHYFSEGFFPPLNEYGDIDTYEFTEDLNVNFTDSTLVKVAGRVVGGTVEGSKKLGFGLSQNNVGVATLNFDLQNDAYALPTQTVSTDAKTGEYEIYLIPETFVVNNFVTEAGYDMTELPTVDFSNSLDLIEVADTTWDYSYYINGQIKDSTMLISNYSYNHDLSYVFSVDPTVSFYQTNFTGLAGDTIVYFDNQETGDKDTLYLGNHSLLDYPVFQMGHTYEVNTTVFEQYNNPYHPDGALIDIVPVNDAEITITNNLKAGESSMVGSTDANGIFTSSFLAGLPNVSEDGENSFTKTIEVSAKVKGQTYYWEGDGENLARAYILGASPLAGTDFVTYGPEVPEVILRDPPGSKSYAFIEKGSSFSTSKSYETNSVSNSTLDYTFHSGIYNLSGVGTYVETDFQLDNTYGLKLTKEYNSEGQFMETVTFKERIETSADPEDVGSMADIYIGKAYNAYMSQTKSLKPLPKGFADFNGIPYVGGSASSDTDLVLGLIDGFAINDDSTSTYFMYTQKHIVNELIPNLIVLRNTLLLEPEYSSNLPASHRFYGMSNDHSALDAFKLDSIAANPSLDTANISYTFTQSYQGQIDSVSLLNQQLDVWLSTILINEEEKATAELVKNISIDGSAGAYTSSIMQEFNSSYNYKRVNSLGYYTDAAMGLTVSGKGFTLSTASDTQFEFVTSEGNTKSNSIEFGYVIEDGDEGDYYSIDVLADPAVKYTSFESFSKNVENVSLDDYELVKTMLAGGTAVSSFAYTSQVFSKMATQVVDKAAKGNAIAASVSFGLNAAVHLMDLASLAPYAVKVKNSLGSTEFYSVNDFAISSPIFSIKGGQTKCPYEGDEFTSVYVDDNGDYVKLNTGTLQREIPVIGIEPSIRTNVPENEAAIFTLKLQNQSASGSDSWYAIEVIDGTNPDGLALKIDGQSAESDFFVPAYGTLTKTLTATKTNPNVDRYDSIGVVFRSTCQYDPANLQDDIADTVYFTVEFTPACPSVEVQGLQDNWVVNYADNDEAAVSLTGYDINSTTLSTISFQYKTLSGSPVAVKTFFIDTTSTDYQTYTGEKGLLDNSTESMVWDVSNLPDRSYMVRAKSTCSDGSIYESDYLSGLLDTQTPVVFGTPSPTDGILDPSDDIKIRFNEELEAGLVKDYNISVRSVLNGADVSHGTSVVFNGINEFGRIPSISFNNKPITIEYWLNRDAGTSGTVFSKGAGSDQLNIAFNSDETMDVTVGSTVINVDPSSYYTSVTPVDSWHHWAVVYDNTQDQVSVYMDDKLLITNSNIAFSPRNAEIAYVAQNTDGTNSLAAQMHELRIWESALTVSEVVENMSLTLTGNEIGLYGYWPMNDGDGVLAQDLSAGRHMTLDAGWELFPGSEAFGFTGSNYLTLDGTNVAITDETDFTIEFWFSAATPTSTQTIFSSGKGDGSDTLGGNVDYALSINATSAGSIVVESNGNSFTAVNTNYFDDQWHHFALVVDRQSTTRTYIDGVMQKSSSAIGINGLAGAKFWLGTRGYLSDPITSTVDQAFSGELDEFRIWNSARNADYIELYKNSKLNGDESGLLLYLPFEEYTEVQGTIIRSSSLSDEVTSSSATDAIATGSENFVNGAQIKDVRPVQDIPFEFVVNGDEIAITPIVDAYRIEGQTLEINVSDLTDLNGNRQLSTVSWTAYVQQNELVWQESSISISHEPGTSSTFKASIVNKGGTAYSYSLSNLPTWLSSNAETGTVDPGVTKEITFTISDGLNVGYYEQGVNLSTSLDFDEKLNITVSVTETAPDWSVDKSKYQYSMSVFGRLIIEDVLSSDINDMVGAFVGEESRGVANVQYVQALDAYLVFLTIYSNEADNEDITLRVWDASEGQIHGDVTPAITFLSNSIMGTSTNPQDIIASNAITNTLSLNSGWSWVSFNLETSKLAYVDSIFSGIGTSGDLVKNQDYFDIYEPETGWLGTLTLAHNGFAVEDMYKVYLENGGTVSYTGTPADPITTAISVSDGWNYIGYTPQVQLTLTEAMADLNPQSGDLIKNQGKFAMYDVFLGWVGSLTKLQSGEGYMYFSNQSASFTYPEYSSLSSSRIGESDVVITLPEDWKLDESQFADNMSVIAQLDGIVPAADDILLAFVNDEIRGYAVPTILDNGETYYFLTIHGNTDAEVSFKLYNMTTKTSQDASNVLSYTNNKMAGNLRSSYEVNFEGIEDGEDNFLVSPNPFSTTLSFSVGCENGTVELYNSIGIKVTEFQLTGSNTRIELDNTLPSGTYTVRATTSCGTFTRSVLKIK